MSNNEDPMDKPVTKRELLEVLDLWGSAFEARIDAKTDAKLDKLEAKLEAKIDAKIDAKLAEQTKVLSAEFARHADRILDETKKIVGVLIEPLKDLPKRVEVLEAKAKQNEDLPERVAALEAKAFPPKRQRRR